MSTWKMNKTERTNAPGHRTVPVIVDADNPPASALEVDVLEIDLESEMDCDPYNRTGQFCVPKFDKRDE